MIDGKERVANRSTEDGVTRAKAYWDGDTLVIQKQQETDRGQVAFVVRYTLSQDGKAWPLLITLIDRHSVPLLTSRLPMRSKSRLSLS